MTGPSVLLMLLASAAVTFALLRIVIATNLTERLERHRDEIEIRRAAARLIAEVERFRRS